MFQLQETYQFLGMLGAFFFCMSQGGKNVRCVLRQSGFKYLEMKYK